MQLGPRRRSRWGRVTEGKMERWYGRDVVDMLHVGSMGLTTPVPIIGVGASAYRGCFLPRVTGAGFSSLSDLIAEATVNGKRQDVLYSKVGVAPGATAGTAPLWNVGNLPGAGGVGGTSGTGAVPARTATGALKQANAAGGDTLHVVSWTGTATLAGTILLYDRLWHMTYNHATSTSTAVDSSNRPSRYNGTDAAGNFVTSEVTTALSATAHTITLTYVDQGGNTAEANAATSARVSSAVQTIGLTAPAWTYALNAADTGLRYLTNVAQSTTASVTGVSSFVIGHPLAWLPQPAANIGLVLDGVNSAFSLVQVKDDACLALMDLVKTANTATTINGQITLVSG